MKKLILAAGLTAAMLAPLPASAQHKVDTAPGIDGDFTGPYIGGTVGYTFGSFETDAGGVGDDVGMDGVQGGALAGYGFQFDPYFMSWLWDGYAALELGYEWGGVDGDTAGTEFEKNDSWMITFRPGLTWGDAALGYGIIGYSRTEFESGAEEEDLDALVLGAGTSLTAIGPLKTRLEYVYSNYEDEEFGATDFDGHDSTLKLGAVFHF